MYIIYFHWFN